MSIRLGSSVRIRETGAAGVVIRVNQADGRYLVQYRLPRGRPGRPSNPLPGEVVEEWFSGDDLERM